MSYFSGISKVLFPSIVAPSNLKGLPPSWGGILKRIFKSTKDHATFGKHTIALLSRDEYQRLAKYNFDEMVNQYPNQYREVDIDDYSRNSVKKNDG